MDYKQRKRTKVTAEKLKKVIKKSQEMYTTVKQRGGLRQKSQ